MNFFMVSEPDKLKRATMASSSTTPLIPSNLSVLLSNLSALVTVKLDGTNFIVWKGQMQNILRATYLLKFVDGPFPCPDEKI